VTSDTDVTSPNDGDARLEVAVPVPEYGWVLAYSRSMASVAGALQDFYRRQVLALGSVSLIALLAAYVISQSLSGPLRRLAEQTRAFGRGDGARPASLLPLEGPPEVRTLAGALNQMTVEIDQRFAEQESAKAALREAEARYRGIFEHAVEGIFQTGFDGRIRTVNLAGARMLGYASTEEFLAESPDIRQIYVDPARLEDFVRSMERDGEVTGFELEARRKDGTRCWLLVNARATRDDGGRIEQVDGLVSDITERKRGEQERDEILAREQAARADAERAADRITRLQDITVALSEALTPGQVMDVITEHGVAALAAYAGGVALVTPEGAELEVVRAVGYPPDIPARALRYPVTADNPPAEAVRTGAPVWVEVVAEHESRFPRHAAAAIEGSGSQAIAAIPLMEADRAIGALALSFGEVRRFSAEDRAFLIALARQCSQALARARLYEAERAARAEAEEANRAKDEFLSTLSHELRTPLTPILGWIAMLRRGSLDEKAQQRAFEIIERSAKAQVQLVADLLDVSRIVTGKLHLEPRPVDFDDVVRASAAVVQPAADAKRIALTLSLPPRSTLLMGDPDRLQQVVWNLLSNAVKFTPEGGQVTVRLGQVERDAVLSVSDSGIGIPPAFLPYVFDRFRQADATSTRRFGGLGLGLAIVRHLVELHGGSVTAASEGDGRGATFAVRLPLAAPVLEERRDEPDPEVGTANGEASTMLAGLHVLVLDDETDTREFLRTLLETYQADVTMAASSAEALAALDRTRPDVVLADIAMPGQDGYEFIARMRARPLEDGGGIPAVAITAYASGSDRARALAAGFQEHLPKPVDGDEVLSVVQRLAARTDGAMR
jgi:PAS domain S-box-containing protein